MDQSRGCSILVVFAIGVTKLDANSTDCTGRRISTERARVYFGGAIDWHHGRKNHHPPYSAQCAPAILVSVTLGIADMIITESALSFLGLGFPRFSLWGRLLGGSGEYLQLYLSV